MANELTMTKEQTARFVHDAVEMESAVFTLDRAIKECEKRKTEQQSEADSQNQECVAAKTKVWKAKQDVDDISPPKTFEEYTRDLQGQRYYEKKHLKKEFTSVIPKSILFTLIALAVSAIFILATYSTSYSAASSGEETWTDFYAVVGIFSLPVAITLLRQIIKICKAYGEYQKSIRASRKLNTSNQTLYEEYLKAHEYHKQRLHEEYREAQKELNNKTNQRQKTLDGINLLTTQISNLRANRNQIQSTLSRFYDIGIIPPDYRYMDCTIMLDQIFRNDLADTMRDAIRIYEERIFRGEVIKGMDRICSMLGNLSAGMIAIEQRLNSIDSNVKMMSQDLYTFSERIAAGQAKQQKATAELLEETKMHRYAAEQVAESAKNLEWHERRRQGWV